MNNRKFFSIPVLGVLKHSKKTREILEPYAAQSKQSCFVRDAIVSYASRRGFAYNDSTNGNRPNFVPAQVWNKILDLQAKSKRVNYSYVIAFYWLKSLPEFTLHPKSKLFREIIECHECYQ